MTVPRPEPAPNDPLPTSASPPETALDAYIRENHLRYSEEALRKAARAAGNHPDAIEAALERYRPDAGTRPARRAARRLTRGIYLAAFVVLAVGMAVNGITQAGSSYGGSWIGIPVWGVVVALGYAASTIWLRSRRTGLVIIGVAILLIGLLAWGMGGPGPLLFVVVGIAIAGAAWVYGPRFNPAISTSLPVMLSMPLLIVLALGGACIATGLPIPISLGGGP